MIRDYCVNDSFQGKVPEFHQLCVLNSFYAECALVVHSEFRAASSLCICTGEMNTILLIDIPSFSDFMMMVVVGPNILLGGHLVTVKARAHHSHHFHINETSVCPVWKPLHSRFSFK